MSRIPFTILSLVCYSTFLVQVSTLAVSPYSLTLPSNSTKDLTHISSRPIFVTPSSNPSLPSNPYVFESEGCRVVYTILGTDSFPAQETQEFVMSLSIDIEEEAREQGLDTSDPIPGGYLIFRDAASASGLEWYIQRPVSGTRDVQDPLTYELAHLAQWGLWELVMKYGSEMVRAYTFALSKGSALMAEGRLQGIQPSQNSIVARSSSANLTSEDLTTQNLTRPPNPFTYTTIDYKVIYTILGTSTLFPSPLRRFLLALFQAIENAASMQGLQLTDPIPGARLEYTALTVLGRLEWSISQVSEAHTDLTYRMAQTALRGSLFLVDEYGSDQVRTYSFTLYDLRSTDPPAVVAEGTMQKQVRGPSSSVTARSLAMASNLTLPPDPWTFNYGDITITYISRDSSDSVPNASLRVFIGQGVTILERARTETGRALTDPIPNGVLHYENLSVGMRFQMIESGPAALGKLTYLFAETIMLATGHMAVMYGGANVPTFLFSAWERGLGLLVAVGGLEKIPTGPAPGTVGSITDREVE